MKKYELITETLRDMTPDPETFKDTVYPAEEVELDQEVLQSLKDDPNYKAPNKQKKAVVLEKIFTDYAEQDDWFGEEALYADDPDWRAFLTVPASEIDDAFQHIDMIATISNEVTNHEVIPFAIDLTYDNRARKLDGKFGWKHAYGKTDLAPKEVSEFGQIPTEQPGHTPHTQNMERLPRAWRKGLRIPGFASAKYFEDTNSVWDPVLPKGRIEVMPRFIVGFNPEIAQILANGLPNRYETVMKYGQKAYDRREQEYNFAKAGAKWCTLFELSEQATDIKKYLGNLSDKKVEAVSPDELHTAKTQINALSQYFDNAVVVAKKAAEHDALEQEAIAYAEQDRVCRDILRQSEWTYGKNRCRARAVAARKHRGHQAG